MAGLQEAGELPATAGAAKCSLNKSGVAARWATGSCRSPPPPPPTAGRPAGSLPQVPTLWFASFLAFNVLAWAALRIINRKSAIKHPKNLVYIKAA